MPRGIVTYLVLALAIIPLLSCCRKSTPQKGDDKKVQPSMVRLASPEPNKVIRCGDMLEIIYQVDDSVTLDSVELFSGKEHHMTVPGNPGKISWNSASSKMGRTTLRLVFYADTLRESHNVIIVILSDIVPLKYTYRIIGKYPHDNQAYTQGLVFDNGHLYESTGLEGKSSVRIVDIKSGNPVRVTPLEPQYFGEGIALFKDQVYQITYKSQVGFVYDKETLARLRSFDYQIREGWGLTTDGTNLIMSDGSSALFFIEPEFFTQVGVIHVFDNQGMVDSLNEIEYINGKIFANVYGQTYIVIIDPLTGKVLGKAEFKDIMPEGSINDYSRVLNGIAWNPETRHLYITGKNWPVLYEVELVPAI